LLAAVAGLLAWRSSDAGIKGWGTEVFGQGRDAAALALAATAIVIVLVLARAIVHLIRQNGRLLIRIENLEQRLPLPNASHTGAETNAAGLAIGSMAPSFEGRTPAGGRLSLKELLTSAKPVLLLFSEANCEACKMLLPHVAKWQLEHADTLTIAVVSHGTAADHGQAYNLKSAIL
jgi:AhpC/TSA family